MKVCAYETDRQTDRVKERDRQREGEDNVCEVICVCMCVCVCVVEEMCMFKSDRILTYLNAGDSKLRGRKTERKWCKIPKKLEKNRRK